MAQRVRMRWLRTGHLRCKDEMFGFDVELPDSGQRLDGVSPMPQRFNGRRIERNPTQSGSRTPDFSILPLPGDGDDGLIDGDRGAPPKSRSFHRTAQASPRRIPVAATSRTKAYIRLSTRLAAAMRARTSSTVGARTCSDWSWRAQSGSSVSAIGFGSVLPLHFRERRQARCSMARVWRTLASDSPFSFSERK